MLHMVDPKRISGRFEFRIEFSGVVQRYGKEVSFRGWSRDLSESGMGAYIPVELREGEQVNLDLTLEAGAPKLRVAAKVRRAQGFEYGFEFVTLSATQRAAITSAVAHCGDAPYL
jgi:c-di-GMP-binding flagellar brake protein YcgR